MSYVLGRFAYRLTDPARLRTQNCWFWQLQLAQFGNLIWPTPCVEFLRTGVLRKNPVGVRIERVTVRRLHDVEGVHPPCQEVRNLRTIVSDGLTFFAAASRRRAAVAAENLFLRKLALFREREKKAMTTAPADRFVFSKLARWFANGQTIKLHVDRT
jgi:hypothetical protein